MQCPHCKGKKFVIALWATQITGTGEKPIRGPKRCQTCNGKGWVTNKQNAAFELDQARWEKKKAPDSSSDSQEG